MAATRKVQQTHADKLIAKLSESDRLELHQLCAARSNTTDLHRWLNDRGVGAVSYSSVLTWYRREYPVGAEAQQTNMLMAAFAGINPVAAHEMSLTLVCRLVDRIQQAIADTEDMNKVNATLLSNLTDLVREQRQSALAFEQRQRMSDRKELELAGGYRVRDIATRLAEGQPNAAWMDDILAGALKQLEQEVSG